MYTLHHMHVYTAPHACIHCTTCMYTLHHMHVYTAPHACIHCTTCMYTLHHMHVYTAPHVALNLMCGTVYLILRSEPELLVQLCAWSSMTDTVMHVGKNTPESRFECSFLAMTQLRKSEEKIFACILILSVCNRSWPPCFTKPHPCLTKPN